MDILKPEFRVEGNPLSTTWIRFPGVGSGEWTQVDTAALILAIATDYGNWINGCGNHTE
jgi:hypothetical protein